MHWSEQVFRYCERGHDPGLLAEPLNALSSLAFVAVAAIAAQQFFRARLRGKGDDMLRADASWMAVGLMIALVALIGVGSFLFHVLATGWAQLADVAPITAFMLAYLAFALRLLLGLSWVATGAGVAALALALVAIVALCPPDVGASVPACLNGTAAYGPALLALASVGVALLWRGDAAAGTVLLAAGLVLVSMAMRTADVALCDVTRVAGHAVGLHMLWHFLNAAALYLLLGVATEAVPEPRCKVKQDAP